MLKIFSRINEKRFFIFSNFVFWFSIFLMLFTSGISTLDPDFSWHLRVGQDIRQNKQIPQVEEYIFPTLGEHWVDHEWLSNLSLFLVYNAFGKFGYWALGLIFALIATYTIFLISKTTKKYFLQKTSDWNFFFFNSASIILGLLSLQRAYGIRLQVLTWLFFTLLFVFYFKIIKENKWYYLLGYPILFFLWTNFHGTFVLGLAIAFAILGFLFLETKNIKRKKQIVLTTFATIAITLLNPYGLELWKLIAIEYTQNRSYLIKIFEWLPLYAAPYIEWYSTFYLSLLIFISAAYIKFNKFPKKKRVFAYYFFAFAIMAMAIKARRFIPMLVLSFFPLVTFMLSSFKLNITIKKQFGLLLIILALPFLAHKTYYISTVPLDLFTQNNVVSPYKALNFIKENESLRNLRTYNRYGWGGYLVWMWPEKLHFIDGRMPQRPLTNNLSLIEEYFSFRESKEMAEKKLSEYEMDLVLLEKDFLIQDTLSDKEIFIMEKIFAINLDEFNSEDQLRAYLDEKWEKIYTDEISIIYVSPEIKFSK